MRIRHTGRNSEIPGSGDARCRTVDVRGMAVRECVMSRGL